MDNSDKENVFRSVNGGRPYKDPLEDLLDKIKGFFSGGGGGSRNGGGGGKGKDPFSSRNIAYGVLVIFVIVGVFTSIYTVDVSEEGVVTRFDKYHVTTPSGLHFKLPYFIDQVTKVPSKIVLQEEFGFRSAGQQAGKEQYAKHGFGEESLMLTGDLNVADVEWIVQFRISDPWKFLFHARNVQKNIRDISMSIMRRVVGDRLVGDVLTVGRVEIADEAQKLTQEVLDKYDMGITIASVVLQDVTPPETVKAAFNDVNSAKQEQEKAVNEAEREYNNVIPEAKGKAEQLIADAEAFAVSRINQSKGDASNFNSVMVEFRRAPDVTRRRLYVEAMEEIFTNVERLIVVDSKIKGVLPLFPSPQSIVPVDSTAKEVKSE